MCLIEVMRNAMHLKVGRRPRQALYVDAPFGRIKVKSIQRSLLAQSLGFIDVLSAAVISGTGVA
jgi:hypothetical protein